MGSQKPPPENPRADRSLGDRGCQLDSFQTAKCEDSLRRQLSTGAGEATYLLLENGFFREGAEGAPRARYSTERTAVGRPNPPLGFIYNPNYTLQEEQLLIDPVTN